MYLIRKNDPKYGAEILYGYRNVVSWGPSERYGETFETRSEAERVAKLVRQGRRGQGIRVEKVGADA